MGPGGGIIEGGPISLVTTHLRRSSSAKVHLMSVIVEVALSWEVQPFRVTKLIAVEVDLSTPKPVDISLHGVGEQ